jgi:hypothetical protein
MEVPIPPFYRREIFGHLDARDLSMGRSPFPGQLEEWFEFLLFPVSREDPLGLFREQYAVFFPRLSIRVGALWGLFGSLLF